MSRSAATSPSASAHSLPPKPKAAPPPPCQPWKPLTKTEKFFLIAVERGDLASVRRFLTTPASDFNMNCCDPIGRSALLMAIDNENLDMIEELLK